MPQEDESEPLRILPGNPARIVLPFPTPLSERLCTGAIDPSISAASMAVAAKGVVQHGVGIANVDEKIGKGIPIRSCLTPRPKALGYLQVNTGNYQAGIALFDQLLRGNPRVVCVSALSHYRIHPKQLAGFLGRGTAFALLGQLDKV